MFVYAYVRACACVHVHVHVRVRACVLALVRARAQDPNLKPKRVWHVLPDLARWPNDYSELVFDQVPTTFEMFRKIPMSSSSSDELVMIP